MATRVSQGVRKSLGIRTLTCNVDTSGSMVSTTEATPCGHDAELRSCVKVEVAVLGSPRP